MERGKLDDIIDSRYPAYRSENLYAGGKDICGYLPLYEKHLPDEVDEFLEIGIAMGISIKMFRDYYREKNGFNEAGNFHAMNMNWGNAGVISKRELSEQGIECLEGDQSDVEFLKTIKTQFDVIIDDGSHRSDHQIITFKQMFTNNLKSGGVYVVEDLHCCLDTYWWGDVGKFENTLLYLLLGFEKTVTKPIENIFATSHPQPLHDTSEFFKDMPIKKVCLYNPSIAFIWS